jgi:hypothetical protein
LHVGLLRHALVDGNADLDLARGTAAGLRLEQPAHFGIGQHVGASAADLLAHRPL